MRSRENHESTRISSPEYYCNNPHEIAFLSPVERLELISKIEALLAEQAVEYDSATRDKYRRLLQSLRIAASGDPKPRSDAFTLSEEYVMSINGERQALQAVAYTTNDLKDVALLDYIDVQAIDREKSQAVTLLISSEQRTFYINLRLLDVATKDGKNHRLLYIMDRYVTPALRGKNIGKGLLKIADQVAVANGCAVIFGALVPEDPKDLDVLKNGHRNAGYKITNSRGAIVAKKLLS